MARTKAQTRRLSEANARLTGPQVPGGRYLCAYWQRPYEVLAMGSMADGGWPWFRIQWLDSGEVTTHQTPWDKRDRVLS
jgi:hypothetical protein